MTTTIDQSAIDALKRQHHDTWADGDYARVAEQIDVALPHAALAGLSLDGADVLDVAAGTGNTALLAAERGARVTGLDLVDDLLDVARQRAAQLGLTVRWDEGDVEALPYADDSFDVVTSTVGVQFAPRADVVASELRRVLRPGGRIVLVNWTREGMVGQLFSVMSRFMPAPPAWVTAPPAWGDESVLRELFAGDEISFERGVNPFRFPSLQQYMTFFEENYGPTKRAKEKLQSEGRWEALNADLRELYTGLNSATDGTLLIDSEFFAATIQPAG